jgi:hypothetical protein
MGPSMPPRDTFVGWAQRHPARIFLGASAFAGASFLLLPPDFRALAWAAGGGALAAAFVLLDMALGRWPRLSSRRGVREALEFCCTMPLLLSPAQAFSVWAQAHPLDAAAPHLWLAFVAQAGAVGLLAMAAPVLAARGFARQ